MLIRGGSGISACSTCVAGWRKISLRGWRVTPGRILTSMRSPRNWMRSCGSLKTTRTCRCTLPSTRRGSTCRSTLPSVRSTTSRRATRRPGLSRGCPARPRPHSWPSSSTSSAAGTETHCTRVYLVICWQPRGWIPSTLDISNMLLLNRWRRCHVPVRATPRITRGRDWAFCGDGDYLAAGFTPDGPRLAAPVGAVALRRLLPGARRGGRGPRGGRPLGCGGEPGRDRTGSKRASGVRYEGVSDDGGPAGPSPVEQLGLGPYLPESCPELAALAPFRRPLETAMARVAQRITGTLVAHADRHLKPVRLDNIAVGQLDRQRSLNHHRSRGNDPY